MTKQFFPRIKLPLLFALMNGLAWSFLGPHLPETLSIILFNGVRLILIWWAGALALQEGEAELWPSAVAGAMVLAVDHLLVTGGIFLLGGHFAASFGVVISFVMMVWLAMLLGALAGLIRRKGFSNEAKYST